MKAPIPLARNEVALAAVGGKIHVIGGGVKGVAGTYHDEYDPATDYSIIFNRRIAPTTKPAFRSIRIAASKR